ncbi:hypothetical protein HF888_01340 [Bermanella marisrubri]|uniref:Outer membrane protein n=1 Tax=Bermanella marisrubri TaxID=207949 RepID=Q1MYH2_9GAMM|nr:hypothetical protein [Bermanella marisrubri]EAT11059.1 hypothetical protein RED65_14467 [Oceanobacter sp. RED65] [Bermanella marisrubri]QIZ82958.1 hypothetical protein HF888_01340 [Bermanella marisrubri]
MRGTTLFALCFPFLVSAQELVAPNNAVVPNDQPYFIKNSERSELIYTKGNKKFAEYTLGFEKKLLPLYDQTFGYSLDSKLSVGLISEQNQIANGFSTQYPNNRQINYMGGAQSIDYFASPSWLDTLLIHETAHNYQTNAKASPVSRGVHTIARNGMFLFPIFATPNAFESSFILEGNAVLNESWHGEGGRLYSGRYRAMYHAHAQAGYLTKSRLYNNTLNFPYGEGHYIFGGFYQAFLAEKYNLFPVNNYFWQRSKNWYFPFTINTPSRRTFGWDFDTLFSQWKLQSENISDNFRMVKGEIIARSQFYSDISKTNEFLVFVSNESGNRQPILNEYNALNDVLLRKKSNLNGSRIFSIDNRYYSIDSRHTSAEKISQGLFDEDGYILQGSSGKIVQGYLKNGSVAYFKTSESYRSPQLYINDEFYDEVHSSVLVQENDLFYFKQVDDQRILYRNRKALIAFPGFYSIVSDVDERGNIYFIANSALGSSLYRYGKAGIEKVIDADNVLSAKLLNDNQVIVTAVNADEYYFAITDLKAKKTSPFIVNYFWDTNSVEPDVDLTDTAPVAIDSDTHYGFANSIRYAAGSFFTQKDDEDNTLYTAAFNFSDPLTYHNLSLFAQRDADLTTQVGISYANNQHRLMYGLQAYGIAENGLEEIENNNPLFETRDFGLGLDLRYPLIKQGHWDIYGRSGYFQDYKNIEKEPLSFSLSANNVQAFGTSMFLNKGIESKVYGVRDRQQNILGGQMGVYTSGLWQTYANAKVQYSHFDGDVNGYYQEGILLSKSVAFFGNDPSGFYMPSLYEDAVASKAGKAEFNISKVFNGAYYGFWFPISIRRQALTLSYRYYDLSDVISYVSDRSGFVNFGDINLRQTAVSVELDTLFFHKFSIRLKIESVFNDDERVTEKNKTYMSVAVPF